MNSAYQKWQTHSRKNVDGVVVATDITQEWLLPWWWENFRKYNACPVAFVNFCMSEEKKAWCREHGELIPLLVVDDFVAEREEIATELVSDWEKSFSKKFWPSRNAWFKKSLACLQSPFQRTIWCDLDCEIRGSIEPLFAYSEHPSGIALRREDPRESLSYPVYNSGVIVFQRNLPLIEEWARQSFEKNHEFCGDQDLLSHLIDGKEIGELPKEYNWSRCLGENPNALIYHWHGEFGRTVIRGRMLQNSLRSF